MEHWNIVPLLLAAHESSWQVVPSDSSRNCLPFDELTSDSSMELVRRSTTDSSMVSSRSSVSSCSLDSLRLRLPANNFRQAVGLLFGGASGSCRIGSSSDARWSSLRSNGGRRTNCAAFCRLRSSSCDAELSRRTMEAPFEPVVENPGSCDATPS